MSVFGFLTMVGVACVLALGASGIGLIISAVVKSESAAAHVGLAVALVTYFIGIAFPYGDLPVLMQPLAHYNPLPLANSMMAEFALGGNITGFNPLTLVDGIFLLSTCGFFFVVGMYLYSRYCWRR